MKVFFTKNETGVKVENLIFGETDGAKSLFS